MPRSSSSIPSSWPSACCAWRAIVGRERVMASADCGFASTLSLNEPPEIEPEIVWAKFNSLAEGARLASRTLWR